MQLSGHYPSTAATAAGKEDDLMSSEISPVVAGWELALRLRQRRVELGIEVSKICKELGFSRNYWSAVENERKVLAEDSLQKLVKLFELDEREQGELLALRQTARERGWWSGFSAVLNDEMQRLCGLEAGADSVRGYESVLVPGLLQTADYARALMNPDVNVRRVEVDQKVEARLRRQERLTGDDPLHLTALLGEAVLRQEIGGQAVLRRQLAHLATMIETHPDTIEVRVLPFTVTACGLFGAATSYLIDFRNSRLPTVIWQETVTSVGVVDDPMKVRDINGTFGDAIGRALSGQHSLEMIHRCIKELV